MDLLQDLRRNLLLPWRELKVLEKRVTIPDGHLRDLIDVLPPHRHGKGLGLETCAMAGLAGNVCHVILIGLPHLIGIRFLVTAGQHGHDALEGHIVLLVLPEHVGVIEGNPFLPGAMQKKLLGFPVDVLPGRVHRVAMLFQECRHGTHGIGMRIF